MATKIGTIVNDIFEILSSTAEYLPIPLEDPYAHLRRIRKIPYKTYYDSIHNLRKRGVVKIVSKEGQRYIQLTDKGVLETLLLKAMVEVPRKWDGKWRLIIIDIPEDAKGKRDILRRLLRIIFINFKQVCLFIRTLSIEAQSSI